MRRVAGGSQAKRRAERRAKAERLAKRSAAAQVALARRESPQRGGRFVGLADVLTQEMPRTLSALASGVINEWRANIIVRDTACLTVQQRRQVDADIADKLEGLGDARLHALVTGIAYRLDPKAATERSVRAASDRRISVRPAPDAMAYLTGLMPMAAAVACYASLCRYVDTQPAVEGDTRTRDQRIVDEYIVRLTGTSAAGIANNRPAYADDLAMADDRDGHSDGVGDEVAGGMDDNAGGDEVAGAVDDNTGCDEADGDEATGTDDSDGVGDEVAVGMDDEAGGGEATGTANPGHGAHGHGEAAVTDSDLASAGATDADPVAAVRAAYERAVSRSASADGAEPSTNPARERHRSDRPEPRTEDPRRQHGRPRPGDRSAWHLPSGTGVVLNLVITDRTLFAGGDDPVILPGNHPIPAPLARRMLTDLPPEAKVWIRRLYTRPDTGELVAQESRGREFSPAMRRLLLTRDQTCRTPWCNALSRHADHLRPAAADGPTRLDNGQGLSEDCNYTRTAPGWSAGRDPDRPGDIVVTTPTGHRYRSPCPDLIPGHTRPTYPPMDVRHSAEHVWSGSSRTAPDQAHQGADDSSSINSTSARKR
jgi:hypothetical protein